MYNVCDVRAMSNVRRSNHSVRLTRVVVGCMNPKAGCAGSVLNLLDIKQFNHQAELTTGVLEEECSALMTGFFRELREKNRRKR